MPIEQALEELKKYAQDFMAVVDAKTAIQNNKEEFMHKWTKVMQYFNYIMDNSEDFCDEWFDAVDVLYDVSNNNPSLKEWIDLIIQPKQTSKQEQTKPQESRDFDPSFLAHKIESYILEMKNMSVWDSEKVDDLEWEFLECKNDLLNNKNFFEPNHYTSLMNDIDAALYKIKKFNEMINSESFSDIKRM